MNFIQRILEATQDTFPMVSKEQLSTLLFQMHEALVGLNDPSSETFEEDGPMIAELQHSISYGNLLMKETQDDSFDITTLIMECETIPKEERLSLWGSFLAEMLHFEEEPFFLLVELDPGLPLQIAGFLLALIKLGYPAPTILSTGILHRFFAANCHDMGMVCEVYDALHLYATKQLPDYKDCFELVQLASEIAYTSKPLANPLAPVVTPISESPSQSQPEEIQHNPFEHYSLSGHTGSDIYFQSISSPKSCFVFVDSALTYFNVLGEPTTVIIEQHEQFNEQMAILLSRSIEGKLYLSANEILKYIAAFMPEKLTCPSMLRRARIHEAPFGFTCHKQNLANLHTLFGQAFLIHALRVFSSFENGILEEFLGEMIRPLDAAALDTLYQAIDTQLPEHFRARTIRQVGEFLSAPQADALIQRSLKWIFFASMPHLLDRLPDAAINTLVQSKITAQNFKHAASAADHLRNNEQSNLIYCKIFELMISEPSLVEEDSLEHPESPEQIELFLRLKACRDVRSLCHQQSNKLREALSLDIRDAASSFIDGDGWEAIKSANEQNASIVRILKSACRDKLSYPQRSHDLSTLTLLILCNTNPAIDLSLCLNIIHDESKYPGYTPEELVKLKCHTLYECLASEDNEILVNRVIDTLTNTFRQDNWQSVVINRNLLFDTALSNKNYALLRHFFPNEFAIATRDHCITKILDLLPQKLDRPLFHFLLQHPDMFQLVWIIYPKNFRFDALTVQHEGMSVLHLLAHNRERIRSLLLYISREQCYQALMMTNHQGISVLQLSTEADHMLSDLLTYVPHQAHATALQHVLNHPNPPSHLFTLVKPLLLTLISKAAYDPFSFFTRPNDVHNRIALLQKKNAIRGAMDHATLKGAFEDLLSFTSLNAPIEPRVPSMTL